MDDTPADLPAQSRAGILVRRLAEAGLSVTAAVEAMHLSAVSGPILAAAEALVREAADANDVLGSPEVDLAVSRLCEAVDFLAAARAGVLAVASAAEQLVDHGSVGTGSPNVVVARADWERLQAAVESLRGARRQLTAGPPEEGADA